MNRIVEFFVSDQARLVGTLRTALPPPVEIVETHISWVLLAGDFAYKIKKAVNFAFLDFSTLEKRRHYCEEEMRLNSRLSPQIYLAVVAITGNGDAPKLDGTGSAIEYAVKMRRFPQTAQFDVMLADGALLPTHIDAIARRIATFHQSTAIAGSDSSYGSPEAVYLPTRQNFEQMHPMLVDAADLEKLRNLEVWSEGEFHRLKTLFSQRKLQGYIRECHGDLHLANLALFEGESAPFDCIEFNDYLRWIDTISEIAFLAMDLHDKKRPDLAWRLLNVYLEQTGDYPGLALLRYYLVYRALVRAKVACLRYETAIAEGAALEVCREYLNLAESLTRRAHPAIIITHGLSGSGKTTVAGKLATQGAIHIRSDIERKRLYGLTAEARSGSGLDGGLYTAQGSRRTYAKLAELAQVIIAAGYSVIVDATFLKQAERTAFQRIAADSRVPYAILDFQAPVEILRQRIRQREQVGTDASEATTAVLERQLVGHEPLAADEIPLSLKIDSGKEITPTPESLFLALQPLLRSAG